MVLSKVKFFFVILLVQVFFARELAGAPKNRVVDAVTVSRDECIKSIKHNFSVGENEEFNSKLIAKSAVRNLRKSDDGTDHNFENDNKEDARVYYTEIFDNIINGEPIIVKEYCDRIDGTRGCLLQLYTHFDGLRDNPFAFRWVYYNKVYEELPKIPDYARGFLDDIANKSVIVGEMLQPQQFCNNRYK